MRRTYHIAKAERGWLVTLTEDRPGWFGKPITIGRKKSKDAAVLLARLLAGRDAEIIVH